MRKLINKGGRKMTEIKVGIYDINEREYAHRFIVYKICKKTADVAWLISIQGGTRDGERTERFSLETLKSLLSELGTADYTPFSNNNLTKQEG